MKKDTIELWLPLKGYEGLYEISNKGQVRSIDRQLTCVRKGRIVHRIVRGKVIRQFLSPKGYHQAGIYKDGVMQNIFIHRAVASSFVDNPLDYPCVCHIDGNKDNNCAENLRWVEMCKVRKKNN